MIIFEREKAFTYGDEGDRIENIYKDKRKKCVFILHSFDIECSYDIAPNNIRRFFLSSLDISAGKYSSDAPFLFKNMGKH